MTEETLEQNLEETQAQIIALMRENEELKTRVSAPESQPTIRAAVMALENRIGAVMGETGKHPGDFEAMIIDLRSFMANVGQDHPLLDYTGEEAEDVDPAA